MHASRCIFNYHTAPLPPATLVLGKLKRDSNEAAAIAALPCSGQMYETNGSTSPCTLCCEAASRLASGTMETPVEDHSTVFCITKDVTSHVVHRYTKTSAESNSNLRISAGSSVKLLCQRPFTSHRHCRRSSSHFRGGAVLPATRAPGGPGLQLSIKASSLDAQAG